MDTDKKPITTAIEDYLEAIYEIGLEKKVVRVRDIASKMKVKMPTVTSMLKNMSNRNLVQYEKYEYVELSPQGENVAREMHRRHELLRKFLIDILRIDKGIADEEACKMEHTLSGSTLDRFDDLMAFIQACPRTGENWLNHFNQYRQRGRKPGVCKAEGKSFRCEPKCRIGQGAKTGRSAGSK